MTIGSVSERSPTGWWQSRATPSIPTGMAGPPSDPAAHPHPLPLPSFSALIVADAALAAAASELVELVGGRSLGQVSWHDAADAIHRETASPVVVADTSGIDDDQLEALLPRLDAVAAARALPVVLSAGLPQLNLVHGLMVEARMALLCEPSDADWVAALAAAGVPALQALLREEEEAALRRLNAEVARIAELLARLSRGKAQGHAVAERQRTFRVQPVEAASPAAIEAGELRGAIRARRLRDQHLPGGLFEDPAWDMLLDLYAAELEGVRVSVSSLCIAAAVAPTTALRWIGKLTEIGLLRRQPDPADRRRAYVGLTEDGRSGLSGYFTALKRAGLAVP
jgi:hypothetical protein